MPEREFEVVLFDVEYFCDKCGEPMKACTVIATKDGTEHEHVCTNGHYQVLPNHYPRVIRRRYEDG